MIDHISIRDFAIIDNVEVDFDKGLSIITGETGSGKSILVTAISLALGSRADSSYVRNGKDRAVVELIATLGDEEILISREVNAVGKNLCRINGELVTLSQLAEKCREIADIHGQYDNQSLMDQETHINIVDGYHHQIIQPLKKEYEEKYLDYTKAKNSLRELLLLEKDNARKIDFYKYELEEINSANPVPGEDVKLSERLSLLQNSEKLFDYLKTAYEGVSGTEKSVGAYSEIGKTVDNLENISEYSSGIQSLLEESREIYYKLEDIMYSLRDLLGEMTYDPSEIDEIIERLNLLDSLKRKYSEDGKSIDSVLSYRDNIAEQLSQIENFDDEKRKLEDLYNYAKGALLKKGKELSSARKESAFELKEKIKAELKDLNFQDSDVDIILIPENSPGENGLEKAEILITTNIGEPLKPLAKTSSGGEISRIMLAIKNITAAYDGIPTLIFDEIDQGISGKTAAIVGKKLREIASNHQVICITHLPQIAAMADDSFRIYKESDEKKTYTYVQRLSEEEKVLEIARLLGGETISVTAIENAKALIETH